jgi:hypothetical protein
MPYILTPNQAIIPMTLSFLKRVHERTMIGHESWTV